MKTSVKGVIFDIQRFSVHDGPGIRTTVFLKGCPLQCVWCHNPEGRSRQSVLSFLPAKCIGCDYCLKHCPRQAHSLSDNRHVLDRNRCEVCGLCAGGCHAGALELVGREITVDETILEVLKDRTFYETSGGGMTLSGGEPLFQIDFTVALLEAARGEHIHCCIETCGFVHGKQLERVMAGVDLFLYDIKETDPQRHQEFTGVALGPILANLRMLHNAGAKVQLRLPIIPGYNDRADHFERVAGLCAKLPGLIGVEIMPYHPLGIGKLERFGMEARGRLEHKSVQNETVDGWTKELLKLGVNVLK